MLYQACLVLSLALVVMYASNHFFKSPHQVSVVSKQLNKTYDFIIVGGGTAGSVLAARLSEDPDVSVLLLEAGGDYTEQPDYHVPLAFGRFHQTPSDWEYYSQPQDQASQGMNENRNYWPRGRVLGGSHMFNALMYLRGHRKDYEEWAEQGCDGWSYNDVMPYFLKLEDMQNDDLARSKYHRKGGPLSIETTDIFPIRKSLLKAGEELGYGLVDHNGEEIEGFGYTQQTVRKGIRGSTAVEYIGRKAAGRPNLHVGIRHMVTKVVLENNKAVGVTAVTDNRKLFIAARREVILSAGAFNSPQLLMLSGIGRREHLQGLGIPLVKDLPVGENFQDQLQLQLSTSINESLGLTQAIIESTWTKLQYLLFGSGALSFVGSDVNAFFCTGSGAGQGCRPDIAFVYVNAKLGANAMNLRDEVADRYITQWWNESGFSSSILLLHPESRGTVSLRSDDPFDPPLINPRYLTKKADVDGFIRGIRIWEKYLGTPTMKHLGARVDPLKIPGCSDLECSSDVYWECIVRHLATTIHHPSGTCKMGKTGNPTTVVDASLRVHGIAGLRVVDASVMPTSVSGGPMAPVIMLAEKAADMIRGIDTVEEFRQAFMS